jgi:mannosyltransferase
MGGGLEAALSERPIQPSQEDGWNKPLGALAPLAVLALAATLRFYLLDGQSLWGDEGNSVALALRDLASITNGAALDIHPPFYYYLLHFWMLVFGSGEIAVRSLSVLTGVALVWVTYLVGRRLFGYPTALVAGILSAISPLQIQYSQETRMYALAALLSTVSVYLMVRAAQASHRRAALAWLALWSVAAAGALYSHYFTATVLLAENLAVALWLLAAINRPAAANPSSSSRIKLILPAAAAWSCAQLLVLMAFLPWLSVMLGQWANWPAVSQPFGAVEIIGGALSAFSLGLAVTPGEHQWALVAFAAALALGSLPRFIPVKTATSAGPPWGAARLQGIGEFSPLALTVLWLIIPILVMYLLSLRRPMYNPKFLLVATPAFCLLVALGVRRVAGGLRAARDYARADMRRRTSPSALLPTVLVLPLVLAAAGPLGTYYHDPTYFRDDYRAIARTITASAKPGDAIVLNAPGQIDIFSYYYQGAAPVYPLPHQRPLDENDTAANLEAILQNHGRVWVVLWGVAESDPRRFVESWLDSHAFKSTDRWYGNARLALYAVPTSDVRMQRTLDVSFGAGIRLLGYALAGEPATGGDILQLTLFWQPSQAVSQRFKVFAHLLGPGDTLWGQRDSEPGGGLRPTTTWNAGETIRDSYGLLILPGTPPGDYRIEVGMYGLDTGQRLPIADATGRPLGDRLLLPTVRVARPAVAFSPQSLGMSHAREMDFAGAIRLLGYDLVQPGSTDPPQVVLFWQGVQEGRDLRVGLQLINAAGDVAWSQDGPPVVGSYPTTSWPTGEVVRDPHPLPLGGLPRGTYRLLLTITEGGGTLPVTDRGHMIPAGVAEIDAVVIP